MKLPKGVLRSHVRIGKFVAFATGEVQWTEAHMESPNDPISTENAVVSSRRDDAFAQARSGTIRYGPGFFEGITPARAPGRGRQPVRRPWSIPEDFAGHSVLRTVLLAGDRTGSVPDHHSG